MTWTIQVSNPSTVEPWDLEEIKAHLRVTDDEDDAYLDALSVGVREWLESRLSKALITQTIKLRLDGWPCSGVIHLPRPPLTSVTSVQYVDSNGVTQTWGASNYTASIYRQPGTIRPAYGISYPSLRTVPDNVTITYQAGYADAASVPQIVKSAGLVLMGTMFENRESIITGTITAQLPLPLLDGLVNETCHYEYGEDCG